jgi:hypothetical protein
MLLEINTWRNLCRSIGLHGGMLSSADGKFHGTHPFSFTTLLSNSTFMMATFFETLL